MNCKLFSIQLSMQLNKRLKRPGKELEPMKKALTDINGALTAQRVEAHSKTPQNKNTDATFGIHSKLDGHLGIGNKVVRLDANGKTLSVDDTG